MSHSIRPPAVIKNIRLPQSIGDVAFEQKYASAYVHQLLNKRPQRKAEAARWGIETNVRKRRPIASPRANITHRYKKASTFRFLDGSKTVVQQKNGTKISHPPIFACGSDRINKYSVSKPSPKRL